MAGRQATLQISKGETFALLGGQTAAIDNRTIRYAAFADRCHCLGLCVSTAKNASFRKPLCAGFGATHQHDLSGTDASLNL